MAEEEYRKIMLETEQYRLETEKQMLQVMKDILDTINSFVKHEKQMADQQRLRENMPRLHN